ncbi:unnamed protein product [Effrenium voratum]|nr:unnamed protein product [Effrenium voratum]
MAPIGAQPQKKVVGGKSNREGLKLKFFEVLDKDGDGFLKKGEMRALAKLVGFQGDSAEWLEEYSKLCKEVGATPQKGIPKATVLTLLDDTSESGCFCTDKELELLLDTLKKPVVEPSHGEQGLGEQQVFFAGAPFDLSEDAIRRLFKRAGDVANLRLFRLKDGRSRGMGYITYASAKQARRAVRDLHNVEVEGRTILVSAFDHHDRHAKGGKGGDWTKETWPKSQGYGGYEGYDGYDGYEGYEGYEGYGVYDTYEGYDNYADWYGTDAVWEGTLARRRATARCTSWGLPSRCRRSGFSASSRTVVMSRSSGFFNCQMGVHEVKVWSSSLVAKKPGMPCSACTSFSLGTAL